MRVTASVSAAAIILGLVTDLGGALSWLTDRQSPTLGLSTYELVDGHPVLTDGMSTVQAEAGDVLKNRLRLGVPIAVTNLEGKALEPVRVEIRYPSGLRVESAGSGKIDPSGRTIVFDHDLGTLRPTGDFTPLAPLDEIVIPFKFVVVPTVALSQDDVPVYLVTVAGAGRPPFRRRVIDLTATIYAKGRPPITAVLHFSIEPGVQILSQGSDDSETTSPSVAEQSLFRTALGEPARSWRLEMKDRGKSVTYRKYRTGNGDIQAVTVDGVTRRMIVDRDKDGFVDFDLIDATGDGQADQAVTYRGDRLFVDWWPPSGSVEGHPSEVP